MAGDVHRAQDEPAGGVGPDRVALSAAYADSLDDLFTGGDDFTSRDDPAPGRGGPARVGDLGGRAPPSDSSLPGGEDILGAEGGAADRAEVDSGGVEWPDAASLRDFGPRSG